MLERMPAWIALWIPMVCLGAEAAPPGLKSAVLGQADAPEGTIRTDGDTVILTGGGRDAYGYSDGGTVLAYVPTEALNFTFTARVAKAPAGTEDPKYGVAVRTGLDASNRMVTARYDGYSGSRAIQWFFRHEPWRSTHDGSRRLYHSGIEKELAATHPVVGQRPRRRGSGALPAYGHRLHPRSAGQRPPPAFWTAARIFS